MVVLRSFLFLLPLCFFSGEAFNISHFKKFPIWLTEGDCLNEPQYWSFVAEYCPGSSDDYTELSQYYMMMVFTNSTTDPPLIASTSLWYYSKSKTDGDSGIKGSLAENNRCGRCGTFRPCKVGGDYTSDYEPFVRALELQKANQLGVDMFFWMKRKSGITGDNEMNYYPDPKYFDSYEDKGNRHRYGDKKSGKSGAIRYKRVKVIGFAPIGDYEDGLKIPDDSEYVLADVKNDCDTLDPKTVLPSHGMYRLMINGEPRGQKSSFWWKSQYYFPLAGDYFT